MSDSEDDIDFESADEGEGAKQSSGRSRKDSGKSKVKNLKKQDIASKSRQESPKTEAVSNEKTKNDLEEPASQEIVDEQEKSRKPLPSDKTETQMNQIHEIQSTDEESSWSSWGNWGSTLLSTATRSVSTFTHQVEEGFNTVIETVEATLSVPSPDELASAEVAKEKDARPIESEGQLEDMIDEQKDDETSGASSWLGWGVDGLSSISHKVQEKSKTLVSGSLDVLETIGKKTVNALKEGDPGFQKTKSIIGSRTNKPVLSEVLREAREAAAKNTEAELEFEESRKANFGDQFDDAQGLVHLEALEMLSNESEIKVQSILTTLSSETLELMKIQLIGIKDHFEIEESEEDDENDHDFVMLITDRLSDLQIEASPEKIIKAQCESRKCLDSYEEQMAENHLRNGKEEHQKAIQSLALFTSRAVEQFHKAGELILLKKNSSTDFITRAKTLADITRLFCSEVSILSVKFTDFMHSIAENVEDKAAINQYITNIYLEATNSSTYIQDAFQLLLPVLQLATVETRM